MTSSFLLDFLELSFNSRKASPYQISSFIYFFLLETEIINMLKPFCLYNYAYIFFHPFSSFPAWFSFPALFFHACFILDTGNVKKAQLKVTRRLNNSPVRELIFKRRRLKSLNISARDSLYSKQRAETRWERTRGRPGPKRRQRSMRGGKKCAGPEWIERTRRQRKRERKRERGEQEGEVVRNGEKDVAMRISSCGWWRYPAKPGDAWYYCTLCRFRGNVAPLPFRILPRWSLLTASQQVRKDDRPPPHFIRYYRWSDIY